MADFGLRGSGVHAGTQAKKKPPEGGLLTYAIQKGEGMDGLQGELIFAPAFSLVCRCQPRDGVVEPLPGEAATHTPIPSRRGSPGGSTRRFGPARAARPWSCRPCCRLFQRTARRAKKRRTGRRGKFA